MTALPTARPRRGVRALLRDRFERKLAELHVRQSLGFAAAFGEKAERGHCQFCEEPQFRAGLCSKCWEECVGNALASIRQQRELRKAQKGTVGWCPHCQSGKLRYACGHCGASGKQALAGFVFCPGCHSGGLKYGHTPCEDCGERGILEEQEFYSSLPEAQAKALRESLAAEGITELRLCRRLEQLGWAIQVSLYFGKGSKRPYKTYDVEPDGQISVLGGDA